MATVLTAMADDGVSVLLSSHLLAEVERVTDYLVLISNGRLRVHDTVENLLAAHRLVTAPDGRQLDAIAGEVIDSSSIGTQTHRLVRLASPEPVLPPGCESRPVGVEELALAYLREALAPPREVLAGAIR